ncbi:MAG: M1 family metallopeptidase [Candidatus Helarchaeota archaeon]|nr:M1 family metallopeptidase [Candidatus Helarchaeota archaeon]
MSNALPTHYNIHLEPNLKTFEFKGQTEIFITLKDPTQQILLNAVDLNIKYCKAVINSQKKYEEVSFSEDLENELLIIQLPTKTSGEIKVLIDYTGEIRNDMRGFYRSRYSKEGEMKFIAITQFEETEARKCFPCFDHPRYKATFDVEMIVDKDLVAISNAPVVEERVIDDHRKVVKFHRTVKMSTYLLFFGVGEFEFVEDPGEILVRVVTTPGKSQYADVGLKFSRKALTWLEDYYDIKLPLLKIDHIAVADFAFGAMENWGAITYRENLILYYPNKTSRAALETMYEVIAHELTHQWFGDLVSPDDWRYLWLNESFATLFGYAITADCYPDWGIWENFALGTINSAFTRDSLIETFPIELPSGERARITQSTAPIIYSKGGSVLLMLNSYLGENFKLGIRHYLKKFEYSTASSDDFWEAFEEVSKEPITKMMKGWIEQEGYPLIEIEKKDKKFYLTQNRFTYLPYTPSQMWIIPVTIWVQYSNGKSQIVKKMMHQKSEEIEFKEEIIAYKINYKQKGFYRVKYKDQSNLKELYKLVLNKQLPPLDRWGLENDLFAFLIRGDIPIIQYLDFLNNFLEEDAPLPLESIIIHLYQLYNLIKGSFRVKIKEIGRNFSERILEKIGYEPKSDELHAVSNLRSMVMWTAAIFGSQKSVDFALNQFLKIEQGEPIHADIRGAVMRVTSYIDEKKCDWLLKNFEKIDNEPERINFVAALGSIKEDYMEKVLQFTMEKIPPRIKFYPIVLMTRNPNTSPLMWDWFVANIKGLEKFHPSHFERILDAVVSISGIEKEEEVKKFFKSYKIKEKTLQDVLKMALEKLEINSKLRKRYT